MGRVKFLIKLRMCNLSRFDWFPNQVVRTKDNLSEKVNAPNGIILNKIGLEAGSQGFPRKLPTDFSFNMPSSNVNPINQFDQGYYDQQKHLRILYRKICIILANFNI